MNTFVQRRASSLALFALAFGVSSVAEATMTLRMDIGELSQNSHIAFRGTVLSEKDTSIAIGGAMFPAVTYRVAVSETLIGSSADFVEKEGNRVAVITMLKSKGNQRIGNVIRFAKFSGLPTLKVGDEYMLMMTRPSSVGLSTTVGLEQGCFHIDGKTGMATNALNNQGLSPTINGPVSYTALANAVRAAAGQ